MFAVHVGRERIADAADDNGAPACVCKLAAVGVQRDVRGLAAGGQGRRRVDVLERHCVEWRAATTGFFLFLLRAVAGFGGCGR